MSPQAENISRHLLEPVSQELSIRHFLPWTFGNFPSFQILFWDSVSTIPGSTIEPAYRLSVSVLSNSYAKIPIINGRVWESKLLASVWMDGICILRPARASLLSHHERHCGTFQCQGLRLSHSQIVRKASPLFLSFPFYSVLYGGPNEPRQNLKASQVFFVVNLGNTTLVPRSLGLLHPSNCYSCLAVPS